MNHQKKDVERIKMIREAVGNDIPVRIDANQGWSVKEAIKTLNALDEYNVELCEDPIASRIIFYSLHIFF